MLYQQSGSLDLDVTLPKQLNRRLFLKQLAVDLCTSERRILFRTQYVRFYIFSSANWLCYSLSLLDIYYFSLSAHLSDSTEEIEGHKKRRIESTETLWWVAQFFQMRRFVKCNTPSGLNESVANEIVNFTSIEILWHFQSWGKEAKSSNF